MIKFDQPVAGGRIRGEASADKVIIETRADFGGGTPVVMTGEQWEALVEAVAASRRFDGAAAKKPAPVMAPSVPLEDEDCTAAGHHVTGCLCGSPW
jgi:hypothetical protein